jgi:hypothetical protein
MKKSRRPRGIAQILRLAVIVAAVLSAATSCEHFGISIQARLILFFNDLNSSRANAASHISDSSQYKSAGTLDATWWDANFPVPGAGEQQYGMTLLEYSDPANVTGIIYGPPAFDESAIGRAAAFVMVKEGPDYLIQQLHLPASGNNPAIDIQ